MDIERYIRSGILELYTLGLTNLDQNQQVLMMCAKFPRVQEAVEDLVDDMEDFQRQLSQDNLVIKRHFKEPETLILPKIHTQKPSDRIYQNLEALIPGLEKHRDKYADEVTLEDALKQHSVPREEHPYEILHHDNHQWVNKAWIWAFAFVFSIFLAGLVFMFIYYFKSSEAASKAKKIHTEKHASGQASPVLRQ